MSEQLGNDSQCFQFFPYFRELKLLLQEYFLHTFHF